MLGWNEYLNGVKVAEFAIGPPRVVTLFDPVTGEQTGTRAFTPDENLTADGMVASQAIIDNRATILASMAGADFTALQAIIAQTNADLRTDPSQEIKDIARVVRRIVRFITNEFSGTE
jgi:hypothetical protein